MTAAQITLCILATIGAVAVLWAFVGIFVKACMALEDIKQLERDLKYLSNRRNENADEFRSAIRKLEGQMNSLLKTPKGRVK